MTVSITGNATFDDLTLSFAEINGEYSVKLSKVVQADEFSSLTSSHVLKVTQVEQQSFIDAFVWGVKSWQALAVNSRFPQALQLEI